MKMITHLDNKTNNMTNLEFFRYLVLFTNQQNRIGKKFLWIRNLHTLNNINIIPVYHDNDYCFKFVTENDSKKLVNVLKYFCF